MLFASFLFLENGPALYFYMLHPVLKLWVTEVPTIAQLAMTALRVAELGGPAFLTWATWDRAPGRFRTKFGGFPVRIPNVFII